MLYYKHKRKQPPTKWLASRRRKAYLHRPSDKVGLFIFACCSYLCRQAMRQDILNSLILCTKTPQFKNCGALSVFIFYLSCFRLNSIKICQLSPLLQRKLSALILQYLQGFCLLSVYYYLQFISIFEHLQTLSISLFKHNLNLSFMFFILCL